MAFATSHTAGLTQAEIDAEIGRTIALVEQLTAVLDDENRMLAAGGQHSLLDHISQKTALSVKLETAMSGVHDGTFPIDLASENLRETLVQSTQMLSMAMRENVVRLKAAIEVSGWRVNAIMSALREQAEIESSYSADGKLGTAPRGPLAVGRVA